MREARLAVVAAAELAQLAAWASGAVPPLVALPAAVLLAAACWATGRTDAVAAQRLRQAGSVLALLATLIAVPALLSAGSAGLLGVLVPLLAAVQVAQSLTWQAKRDLQVGLLLSAGLLVLTASRLPDVLAAQPLVAGWVAAVHALARVQALRIPVVGLQTPPRPTDAVRAVAAGGAARPPVLAATALAVVLGLVAFLLLPVPQTPRPLRSAGGGGPDNAASQPSRRAQALLGDRVDLRVRGPLGDRILAEVTDLDAPLWRSAAYDTWDGSSWTASGPSGPTLLQGRPFLVPDEPSGATRRDAVRVPDAIGSTPVWSPGIAVSVLSSDPVAVHDATGAVALPQSGPYVVTSVPLATEPAALRRAGAGPVDARYLQLRPSTSDRARALAAAITREAPTAYDKVGAVERWLATHATYTLDPPLPAAGEDAVDRFLFVDHRGYCEQFAAAEVVLLRAAGIPARFVTGLAYGEPKPGGGRLFRERMLHAWVEVPYAGLGWAASDPTAGAAQALAGSSLRDRVAARLAALLRLVDRLPGGRVTAAGLLLLLVAAAVGSRRWLRRPQRRLSASSARLAPPGRPLLAAYLHWDARLGAARRRDVESLAEQRRRMLLSTPRAAALEAVERECFAASPVSTAERDQALVALLDP